MNHWPIFSDPQANDLLNKILILLKEERKHSDVYPSDAHLFKAFEDCDYHQLKVVILGQDPYHTPGCAHGLAFSVPSGIKMPPSLRNIFKELHDDIQVVRLSSDLSDWAKQGVLLLNTSLSVKAHLAHSHKHLGWQDWIHFVMKQLNAYPNPLCFVLWGNHAQKFAPMIDDSKHYIIQSAHPSPLSAYQGFFGSKPFSKINDFTEKHYDTTIHWSDTQ